MGQVVISPNLKKTSVRIDPNGNIIDPKSKIIVEKNLDNEPQDTTPLPPEPTPSPIVEETKKENPLAEAIKKQVQEQVKKTLGEIDIAGMVKNAVEEAFK